MVSPSERAWLSVRLTSSQGLCSRNQPKSASWRSMVMEDDFASVAR